MGRRGGLATLRSPSLRSGSLCSARPPRRQGLPRRRGEFLLSLMGKVNCRRSASQQSLLSTYLVFCRDHLRCTPGTLRCQTRHLTRFLHFLEAHQMPGPAAIKANHISEFMRAQIHLRPKTLAVIVSDLRSFPHAIHEEELCHRLAKRRRRVVGRNRLARARHERSAELSEAFSATRRKLPAVHHHPWH